MSISETIITIITGLLAKGGYGVLLFFTTLDSTVLPVPNEAVMPFAGFLIASGQFSWIPVILVATLGGVIGGLTSYAIGLWGGRKFILRFGRFVGLSETDLDKTNKVFTSHGNHIIFFSRFLPVIRHFISLPAGIARMPLVPFCLYTAAGSLIWNTAILYVGYTLGANWTAIKIYLHYADVAIISLIILFLARWLYKKF